MATLATTRRGGGCTVRNSGATLFPLTCNSLSLTNELDGNGHGSFSDGDRGANGADGLLLSGLGGGAGRTTTATGWRDPLLLAALSLFVVD